MKNPLTYLLAVLLLTAGCRQDDPPVVTAQSPSPVAESPSPSPTASAHSIAGKLVIDPDMDAAVAIARIGSRCVGNEAVKSGGFDDIVPGAQILVKNGSGTILATGVLGEGVVTEGRTYHFCEFPFSVQNVPASDFYVIEMGNRGGMTYSAQDLEQQNWQVSLKLKG